MKFELENLNPNATVSYRERAISDGLTEVDLSIVFDTPTKPDRVTLR